METNLGGSRRARGGVVENGVVPRGETNTPAGELGVLTKSSLSGNLHIGNDHWAISALMLP